MVDIKALCAQRFRYQQGGGVMFWAAIIHDKLVGILQVKDSVKVSLFFLILTLQPPTKNSLASGF